MNFLPSLALGDIVFWKDSEYQNIGSGFVAEIVQSVLLPESMRVRVVPRWNQARDPKAGRWVDARKVLSAA